MVEAGERRRVGWPRDCVRRGCGCEGSGGFVYLWACCLRETTDTWVPSKGQRYEGHARACSGCGAGMGCMESLTSRQLGKCHALPYPGRRRLFEAMVLDRRLEAPPGCSPLMRVRACGFFRASGQHGAASSLAAPRRPCCCGSGRAELSAGCCGATCSMYMCCMVSFGKRIYVSVQGSGDLPVCKELHYRTSLFVHVRSVSTCAAVEYRGLTVVWNLRRLGLRGNSSLL